MKSSVISREKQRDQRMSILSTEHILNQPGGDPLVAIRIHVSNGWRTVAARPSWRWACYSAGPPDPDERSERALGLTHQPGTRNRLREARQHCSDQIDEAFLKIRQHVLRCLHLGDRQLNRRSKIDVVCRDGFLARSRHCRGPT